MSISLDKEWYSIKETSDILGITVATVHNRIKKNKGSIRKINESEYKSDKNKYWISKNYIMRCLKDEWISMKNACILLGKTEKWVHKQINNGKIPESLYKKDCNYMLIHMNYINDRKEYQLNLDQNYYSYDEVSILLRKSNSSISGMVRRGIFLDVISSTAGGFISKKEIDQYMKETESTINLKAIEVELNLSKFQALELIKNEPALIANNVSGQQYYIKRESYQNF